MILAIVGPTGVGKTKLSIELAKIINGEIINCDSLQIYRGLDVGTAKITTEEMEHIPHHLLNIKNVTEPYTVFDYQKDARECIEKIKKKKKVPIFVGGTGMYLKAALYDYQFQEEKENVSSLYHNISNEELQKRIEAYKTGIVFDRENRQRMIRLLSKLDQGIEISQNGFQLIYDDVIVIGLTAQRELLYQRLNKRFDDMLVSLIDEVKPFILNGIKTKPLMIGIGYKEFYDFFENKKTLHQVVEECKQNTRNYAKRQFTWFNNQMDVKWFEVNYESFIETIQEVIAYLESIQK